MRTRILSDNLWPQIERLGRGSPKLAAVAYVSGFDIPFRAGDVLVTDASMAAVTSARTSAAVLLRAANAGATVYSLPGLHAKVVVGAKSAVVGSANLSSSSKQLVEAGVVTTDLRLVREARQLVARLSGQGRRMSIPELRRLAQVPVARYTGAANRTSPRLSLLQALQCNSPLLDTLAFCWYREGAELTKAGVEAAARKRKLQLPIQRRWKWFEWPPKRGAVSRARRICQGRALVSWEVKWDSRQDCIAAFKSHDKPAVPFIDVFVSEGRLVSLYADAPARTPFDIRRDRKTLAAVMTAGIQWASPKLRRAVSEADFMSASQIRNLVALGKRSYIN